MKLLLLAITFLVSATVFSQTTFTSKSYVVNDLSGVEIKSVTNVNKITLTDKKFTLEGGLVRSYIKNSYVVVEVKKIGNKTHYLFDGEPVSATVTFTSGKATQVTVQSSEFGQIIFKQ